jgi:hypothetical protein
VYSLYAFYNKEKRYSLVYEGKKDKLGRSRTKNGGQLNAQESDERENLHQEKKW